MFAPINSTQHLAVAPCRRRWRETHSGFIY